MVFLRYKGEENSNANVQPYDKTLSLCELSKLYLRGIFMSSSLVFAMNLACRLELGLGSAS